jgi:hypothetical protein
MEGWKAVSERLLQHLKFWSQPEHAISMIPVLFIGLLACAVTARRTFRSRMSENPRNQ